MSGIFISYRHEDSQSAAGRLCDVLEREFGAEQVFRDIETIEPGLNFVVAIDRALASSKVVLVVIGPRWTSIVGKDGQRRLSHDNDWVRIETARALASNVRVVPVLVEGAVQPTEADLPPELKELAYRQSHELSDRRWDYDVRQLVDLLGHILGVKRPPIAPPVVPAAGNRKPLSRNVKIGLAIAVGVGLISAIGSGLRPASQDPQQSGLLPTPSGNVGVVKGMAFSACGCWGPATFGVPIPIPGCASGFAEAKQCPGWCQTGPPPWQGICL